MNFAAKAASLHSQVHVSAQLKTLAEQYTRAGGREAPAIR
jgi:hypothetical protein